MTEDTELQGSVTLLSDQGDNKSAFAVVEVKGILMPLIVPAACIKVLVEAEKAANRNGHSDRAASWSNVPKSELTP